MGFKLTLEGSTLDGSSMFSGISGQMGGLTDDAEIAIKRSKITNSQLFSNLNISEFCSKLESQQETAPMSKDEYASIQRVLKKREDRRAFTDALYRHLISFTEGVAASVVATCISK